LAAIEKIHSCVRKNPSAHDCRMMQYGLVLNLKESTYAYQTAPLRAIDRHACHAANDPSKYCTGRIQIPLP
jgi:hypothetical protein